MKRWTQLRNGFDQGLQVIRVHVRGNAMTQIEYMSAALAKTAEDAIGFVADDLGSGE